MSVKKQKQLGMNPSTASHRLVKDILWKLIVETEQDTCFKCGKKMERGTFSIEHITPWLDSENPLMTYFDLGNISFSHHSCNVADKRDTRVLKPCGTPAAYGRGCRCDLCKDAIKEYKKSKYSPDTRSKKYEVNGT